MKMRLNKRYRTTTPLITTTTLYRGDQQPLSDDDDNNIDDENHEDDIEVVPLGVQNQPATVPLIYFTNEGDNTRRRTHSFCH